MIERARPPAASLVYFACVPREKKRAAAAKPSLVASVLIVGLTYGARNVLSYARCMMQNVPALRDVPIIPLRSSPWEDRRRQ